FVAFVGARGQLADTRAHPAAPRPSAGTEPLRLRSATSLDVPRRQGGSGWKAIARAPYRMLLASLWHPLAHALLPFVLLLPLMLLLSWRLARRLQAQYALAAAPQQADIRQALLKDAEARQAAIARELHDAVGSSLAGVNMLL